MSRQLRFIVSLLLVAIAAAQTANAQPISVELAEKTPPADPGDLIPPTTTTTTTTIPACNPIDCGGYFSCFCQVCCPDKPEPCYYVDTTSALETAFSAGCTTAPNNSCGNCSTPVGTGSPAPQCLWVAAWQQYPSEDSEQSPLNQFTYSNFTPIPSCFADKWGAICGVHDYANANQYDIFMQWAGCGYVDDGDFQTGSDVLGAFLGDPQLAHATALVDEDGDTNIYADAYWYMDANCHWATPPADTEVCGFAGLAASPISLLWEEDASLDDGMTVVSFSINARQPEAFSLWKASEKTPLLVYDPTHSGNVASARQLFGSYTFGGKTTTVADYQSLP